MKIKHNSQKKDKITIKKIYENQSVILANSLITLIFIMQSIDNSRQSCGWSPNCTDLSNPSTCVAPYPNQFEPDYFQNSFTQSFACPNLQDSKICCVNTQNLQLLQNFKTLDSTFGSGEENSIGGCDVCVANLKRFWCNFTCGPNQSEYIQVGNYIDVVSPLNKEQILKVLNLTLTVNSNTACSLFQSCKKTQFVTEVAAMQTAIGLIDFLGQQAVSIGYTQINSVFINSTNAMQVKINNCSELFPKGQTDDGFNISNNCSCNNCEQQCQQLSIYQYLSSLNAFEGINWKLIIIFFGCLLLEIAILAIYRKIKKLKRVKSQKLNNHILNNSNIDLQQ